MSFLDTLHVKGFFGYLVKIILNYSCVKKERILENSLKNKLFTVMFHVTFALFWNEYYFMPRNENTLKNNVTMFWKM